MAVARSGDHFEAVGIPVVPVDDAGTWNPYQVAEVVARDASGAALATVRTTIPTSDEIDCARCHGADAFAGVLAAHDRLSGTSLSQRRPVLCASCHASPALGVLARKGGTSFLSEAIHGFHGRLAAASRPACYDCHPGAQTQCSRSLAHAAPDGNCTGCHGALADVGAAARVPWVTEPACSRCHGSAIAQVDTGTALYRNAAGHGGLSCPACHGSPHAMRPSRVASDDAQAVAYQGAARTLGSCRVCHTSVASDTARWPHAFGWKAR
jgi:hypothetical protein